MHCSKLHSKFIEARTNDLLLKETQQNDIGIIIQRGRKIVRKEITLKIEHRRERERVKMSEHERKKRERKRWYTTRK